MFFKNYNQCFKTKKKKFNDLEMTKFLQFSIETLT